MKKEITEILNNADGDTIDNLFRRDYGYGYCDEEDFDQALKKAGVEVKLVDSHGGEGEGDQYWSVYKFSRGDEALYVKFNGWYASYHGSEFTEWMFVEPKEKTITVYE